MPGRAVLLVQLVLPQAEVEHAEVRQLHQPLQAHGGDLGAAVQVDAAQLLQVVGDQAETLVRHAAALAQVQRVQVAQGAGHAPYAVVAHGAGVQAEAAQLEEALRGVQQALVAHLVAEAHVERAQTRPALGQVGQPQVRDVVARAQVELAQARHARRVLQAGVRHARAEAQVQAAQVCQAEADEAQRVVRQLLAVLQAQGLQAQRAVGRLGRHAGQVSDARVRHAAAAAQVQAAQVLEAPGDEQQARVAHVRAAAQVKPLEALEVLRDAAQAVVCDLLAHAQVELGQRVDVLHEGVAQPGVGQVEAADHVERLEVGHPLDDVSQRAAQAEHLHAPNAPPHQAREQRRVGAAQVQLGLDAPPDGLVVGGLAPRRAHLRHAALVAHVQVAEDERQDFGVEPRDVRPAPRRFHGSRRSSAAGFLRSSAMPVRRRR
ncbi:unnamed protein product, partial [Ixodes persulcatus]